MSTSIHGYLIVDKKTGEPDWDGEVHPTAHAAIESLCSNLSFCRAEEATDDEPTYWAEVYDIHPVGPALDPEYAAALADPVGHALVQAIADRMAKDSGARHTLEDVAKELGIETEGLDRA